MPLRAFDKECFLRLWRAILPGFYTASIEAENEGAGLDVPSSEAAQFAQFEDGANLSQQAYYLRPHSTQTGPIASSGRKATGSVELRRAAPAVGAILVPAGSILRAEGTDSYGGVLFLGRYLTTADATLADGSTGPITVPVEAEFVGYTGNLDPGFINGFEGQGGLSVPSLVTTTVRFERSSAALGTADYFRSDLVGRYVRLVGGSLVSENRNTPRRVVAVFTGTGGNVGIEVDLALALADVGQLVTVEVEELADLGVTVTQPAPIAGGVADALGATGVQRQHMRGRGSPTSMSMTRVPP